MTRPIAVLVLDDNPLVSESVGAWLEDDGFDVHSASCGVEAMQLLAAFPIDVALVDLKLPDMNGEKFILQVSSQYPQSRFLIHTGTHSYRISLELQDLGLRDDDVVYKPVLSLEQLTELIRHKARRYVHNAK